VSIFYITFGLFCVNMIGSAGDNDSIHLEEAEDKDVVLVWNSGGWGRKTIEDDPDWVDIFSGIESELRDMGYSTVTVSYIRSENNLRGLLREIAGSLLYFPTRAEKLADEVDLLTESNSDCKVILLATSNGAVFVNEVMKHLEDNPGVYSIQTSRLFWYRASTAQRSLLIDGNGETRDVLSSGNIWSIIRENALRIPTAEKPPGGSVMIGDRYLKAPGHEYMWEQPSVRSEIISFLHTHFQSQ